MKVLFVPRGFPSEKDPMNGNYEAVQAEAIAAKGHEVSVIAVRWRSMIHLFECGKLKYRKVGNVLVCECNGIRMYPFRIPKMDKHIMRWQFKKFFQKYVSDKGMPDIVHAHIISNAAYAVVLKENYHLPFVITEHWSKMFAERISKVTMRDTFAYKKADRVICVSEALAENLKKQCGIQSVVIHNMVSNEFFKSRKIGRHDKLFRFIAVGALRDIKRFDLLVEAFAFCHFPENVKLDIVGEGIERPLIDSKIKQYGLENQVSLLGLKTPEEVSNLLCQSDCFVLSSRLETFSIVVIEAMAKGLPVIATRCGGPETFLRPEDGILVPKENAKELANAMKIMTQHNQDYDAEAIRQYCYDNFSQDVIADKIIDIYKQVLQNNN